MHNRKNISVPNIYSWFDPFVFYLFCCTFSIFKAYCDKFYILMLWCFLWSTSCFSFFNCPISFTFAPNFRHSWLRTTNVFHHIQLWFTFLNEFYDPFCFFNWSQFSFQLGMPNHLLRSRRTNWGWICISRFLLIFISSDAVYCHTQDTTFFRGSYPSVEDN